MLALFWITMFLFLFICLILILLVLIQKGRGGGLSGAFGGGGGGNTAFGAKTGDVLTWATSIIFALFVLFAVILDRVSEKIGTSPQTTVQQLPTLPAGPASPAGQPLSGGPVSLPPPSYPSH